MWTAASAQSAPNIRSVIRGTSILVVASSITAGGGPDAAKRPGQDERASALRSGTGAPVPERNFCCPLQRVEIAHDVLLLLLGQPEAEDEVEELDGVVERQQPAVMQVR